MNGIRNTYLYVCGSQRLLDIRRIYTSAGLKRLRAFFGTHYVTVLTWGEGEATLHVNRCSKLVISGLTFDPQ